MNIHGVAETVKKFVTNSSKSISSPLNGIKVVLQNGDPHTEFSSIKYGVDTQSFLDFTFLPISSSVVTNLTLLKSRDCVRNRRNNTGVS
jgi:hypothetical protein